MTLFGIDIARYQGDVDWVKVKDAGIAFATIKASEGSEGQTSASTRDYFRRHFPRAKAAGLTVGAYCVVRSGSVGPQVDWYLRQLGAVGGGPDEIVLQVDYEKWDYDFPSYATLKAFIAALKSATGCQPVLYCGKWIWDQVSGDPADAAADLEVKLWDSNYGTNPHVGYQQAYPGDGSARWDRSYGGWKPTILQYGSRCIVPGVSNTYCDANAFRGTLAEFRSLFVANEGEAMADINPTQNLPVPDYSWMKGHPQFKDRANIQDGLLVQTTLVEGWGFGEVAVKALERVEANQAALQEKVDRLATGGVDMDALAARVADLLAQRLAE